MHVQISAVSICRHKNAWLLTAALARVKTTKKTAADQLRVQIQQHEADSAE
jgi:hypothetical protein